MNTVGRRFLPVQTPARAFLLGLIWGWLPCGLVYSALALAMTRSGILHTGPKLAKLSRSATQEQRNITPNALITTSSLKCDMATNPQVVAVYLYRIPSVSVGD